MIRAAMVNPDMEQLRTAAVQRLDAAQQLLTQPQSPKPQIVCYLVHIALECALKARILYQSAPSSRMISLRVFLGERQYQQLFESSQGHNLPYLAQQASVKRILEAARQSSLLSGPIWVRMCNGTRPYSLRYGTESIAVHDAQAELSLGQTIVRCIQVSR